MKIVCEVQYDKLGDDFLKEKEEIIEVYFSEPGNFVIKRNTEMIIIPADYFRKGSQ